MFKIRIVLLLWPLLYINTYIHTYVHTKMLYGHIGRSRGKALRCSHHILIHIHAHININGKHGIIQRSYRTTETFICDTYLLMNTYIQTPSGE